MAILNKIDKFLMEQGINDRMPPAPIKKPVATDKINEPYSSFGDRIVIEFSSEVGFEDTPKPIVIYIDSVIGDEAQRLVDKYDNNRIDKILRFTKDPDVIIARAVLTNALREEIRWSLADALPEDINVGTLEFQRKNETTYTLHTYPNSDDFVGPSCIMTIDAFGKLYDCISMVIELSLSDLSGKVH